jgi:hypothetical protein
MQRARQDSFERTKLLPSMVYILIKFVQFYRSFVLKLDFTNN